MNLENQKNNSNEKDSSKEQKENPQKYAHSSQIPEGKNLVSCVICTKEIPQSAAITREGSDYIRYFCGPNCYQQWQQRNGVK